MTRRNYLVQLAPAAVFGLLLCFSSANARAANSAAAADSAKSRPAGANVELDTSRAEPREVEEATQSAIRRDYSAAWKTLAAALGQNRAELLDASFTGVVRDKLASRIADQQRSGLRTRYTDRGHKLEAVFYSPEGSAMELRDTAQLRVEILDGSKVLSAEDVTLHYITLMTVAEDRWKVRVLQSVPGF